MISKDTAIQYLKLLDQVTALANMSRVDHVRVQTAIQELGQFVAESTPSVKIVNEAENPTKPQ